MMAQALEDTQAAKLRDMLVKDGPEVVAERIGLGIVTLLRAAVGLKLHNASCVVIERSLDGTDVA